MRVRLVALTAVGLLALTACGGTSSTTTAASGASSVASSAAAGATGKVNANTATQEELAAAFTAAGIDNPDRWAREVTEYRPYDTKDATMASLRQNLAKYNPPAGLVDKIVAALSL